MTAKTGGTINVFDNLQIAATKALRTDTISETTVNAGITADGVLLKDNDVEADEVRTNTLSVKSASVITVTNDLVPDVSLAYELGTASLRWNNIYANSLNLSGNATILGNLIVSGNLTTIDTEHLLIADNKILLNSGEMGAGVTLGASGWEVDRGSLTNFNVCFDELRDCLVTGIDTVVANLHCVASRVDTVDVNGIAYFNSDNILDTDSAFTWDSANSTLVVDRVCATNEISTDVIDDKTAGFITVNAPFVMSATGAQVRFTDGIEIGNATTSAVATGTAIGKGTLSTGYTSVAVGMRAHALSQNNVALGYLAQALILSGVAVGPDAIAYSQESVAMGPSAHSTGLASITIGKLSKTNGTDAIAIGDTANASADYSIAFGPFSDASGYVGIAVGYSSNALGREAIAIGRGTVSSNDYTIAIGVYTGATANSSVAIGPFSVASGNVSIAVGKSSSASGKQAVAIGRGSVSGNDYSIAMGVAAGAVADSSVSIGPFSVASGSVGIAVGASASASDTGAISIGEMSVSSNIYSMAMGVAASATAKSAVALGSLSVANGNSAVALGPSASATGRSAISIGQISVSSNNYSIAMGVSANAIADLSIAIGHISVASGYVGIAIGYLSSASDIGTVAIGQSTIANDTHSIAMGLSAISMAGNSIAMGCYSNASHVNGIAIGYNATTTLQDDIRIGNPSALIGNATAKAWGQTFQNRQWADTQVGFAKIDGSGNLYKDTGVLSIIGNLDMECYNISNVMSIFVENMYGKSPINFHDTINIKNTVTGGNIIFEGDIKIGDSSTITSGTGSLAIGKGASTTQANSIAIGKSSYIGGAANGSIAIGYQANVAANFECVAIGANIFGVENGGFFIKHRALSSGSFNNAAFNNATSELVEITSSRRFKENIRDLEEISNVFDKLHPVRFRAKPGYGDVNKEVIGMIAEELVELFPEFVTLDAEGLPAGIAYDQIVALLIKEIQSLRERERERLVEISDLKADIESLKLDIRNIMSK